MNYNCVLHQKVSTRLLANEFKEVVRKSAIRSIKQRVKKGYKLIAVSEIRFYQDGNDFIRNLTTLYVHFTQYKRPRYAK